MNFESGHHCKISRSIGVPLGLWPYRRTILGIMNGAFAVTIIVLSMVTQLAVFITHEFSVDLFLKGVIGLVPPTISAVKYFFFMWNMDQVKHTFEWIQNDYDSLTNERDFRLLEKYADRGTYISKSILCFAPILLIFIGYPLLSLHFNVEGHDNQFRSVLIPVNVEYFVDQDRYFYWIMFHIDVATVLSASIVFVTESTFVHFTTHACGLLEIIGDRVERVLESSILNVLYGKTYLSIHGQLVATIKMHQRVLKFIEYLNTSFLSHYCVITVIGVASLSMNLYILVRGMLLMRITGEMLTALILVIVHFFYMGCGNYIGQIMLDKGNELFTKTYYARWHESPLPVQKMLLYIRQRSMQPAGLEFGGLYTGSFEFFSKMVNASMSYFTVLYSVS